MTRKVRQWRASGESQAGFARRHHIPAWTFWYWCRKLAAEPGTESAEPPPPAFVPVRLAVDPDAPVLEVVWSGGEWLYVRAGVAGSSAGHRGSAAIAARTLSPAVRIYLATGTTDLR